MQCTRVVSEAGPRRSRANERETCIFDDRQPPRVGYPACKSIDGLDLALANFSQSKWTPTLWDRPCRIRGRFQPDRLDAFTGMPRMAMQSCLTAAASRE